MPTPRHTSALWPRAGSTSTCTPPRTRRARWVRGVPGGALPPPPPSASTAWARPLSRASQLCGSAATAVCQCATAPPASTGPSSRAGVREDPRGRPHRLRAVRQRRPQGRMARRPGVLATGAVYFSLEPPVSEVFDTHLRRSRSSPAPAGWRRPALPAGRLRARRLRRGRLLPRRAGLRVPPLHRRHVLDRRRRRQPTRGRLPAVRGRDLRQHRQGVLGHCVRGVRRRQVRAGARQRCARARGSSLSPPGALQPKLYPMIRRTTTARRAGCQRPSPARPDGPSAAPRGNRAAPTGLSEQLQVGQGAAGSDSR